VHASHHLSQRMGVDCNSLTSIFQVDDEYKDSLAFWLIWYRNRSRLNKLVYPRLTAVSVPAASSAVEHALNQGGVILTPRTDGCQSTYCHALYF